MSLPTHVTIVEVGPRDGLQMEKVFVPTEAKIALINAIAQAGLRKIEATSFVSPKVIPQLGDAAEVMAGIERFPDVRYIALVPNPKGAERAVTAGADIIKLVICTSDSYNRRNVGKSVSASLQDCAEIFELARHNRKCAEVVIGLSFGCPLEGPIPPERVIELTEQLAAQGYREISIADSMGLANPLQVRMLMRLLLKEFPEIHFSLHLHNHRGLALANVFAAWEEGIDTFDSSIGGLGGSEVVVSAAAGNASTEDLANMFAEMKVETGLNMDKVLEASRIVQSFLSRPLPSYVLTHGTPTHFYRMIREAEGHKLNRD